AELDAQAGLMEDVGDRVCLALGYRLGDRSGRARQQRPGLIGPDAESLSEHVDSGAQVFGDGIEHDYDVVHQGPPTSGGSSAKRRLSSLTRRRNSARENALSKALSSKRTS